MYLKKYMVIVLFFCSGLQATGCTDTEKNAAAQNENINEPDQESWPFNLEMTRDGNVIAAIEADKMAYYANKDLHILNNVTVNFYNSFGDHLSVLTSDSGFVNNRRNITTARQNVIVVSDSGVTLMSEELHYDQRSQRIYTDLFVTFITDNDTIYGEGGFESDASLENYTIKKTRGKSVRVIDKNK